MLQFGIGKGIALQAVKILYMPFVGNLANLIEMVVYGYRTGLCNLPHRQLAASQCPKYYCC